MFEINNIYNMDCIEGMKQIESNSIDSIVTDPPYGLGFMGKEWDTYDKTQFGNKGSEGENDLKVKKNFNILPRYRSDNLFQDFTYAWAKEAYRILKPGGHLLSFGGTRTYHRMASAIEDAGFEIRDMINWTYGSGFPKSLNIGKAVDKLQGNEREILKVRTDGAGNGNSENVMYDTYHKFVATKVFNETKGTSEWEGWGTALKPAHEPIVVARKPLSEKSVVENVLKYGTGGINIDESRVETNEVLSIGSNNHSNAQVFNHNQNIKSEQHNLGRFPANFIHDGSEEVLKEFEKVGISKSNDSIRTRLTLGSFGMPNDSTPEYSDSGTPARFFKSCEFELEDAPSFIYQAKASKSERNEGCEELEEKSNELIGQLNNSIRTNGIIRTTPAPKKNSHPTVKPLKLIEYLVKLVTPKGGICLDPFMGSGTTAVACKKNGFKYLGFEKEAEYIKIINARLSVIKQKKLLEE